MRKIIVYLFVILFSLSLITTTGSAKKKPKTGEVKDNIYQDLRFDFKMAFPEDWKSNTKKEYTSQRLMLQKKNPRVPSRLRNDPSWAIKPIVLIFADSSEMTPDQLFNYLCADTGKSEFKKKILGESILLNKSTKFDLEVLSQHNDKVGGNNCIKISARLQYDAYVTLPGRNEGSTIQDWRFGYIYIVQGDGWLLYIEQACEDQFSKALKPIFDEMIASMTPVTEKTDSTKNQDK